MNYLILLPLFIFLSFSSLAGHAFDLQSEASLKKAIGQSNELKPWLTLKLAELHLNQNQFAEAVRLLESASLSADWDFYKKTRLAQAYSGLNRHDDVLTQLQNLADDPEANPHLQAEFYRPLYKDALLTKKKALLARSQNTDDVSRKLWAFFPDENYPADGKIQAADKIKRLHILSGLKKHDGVIGLLNLSEVDNAPASPAEKCRAYKELGESYKSLKQADSAIAAYGRTLSAGCDTETVARSMYWKAKLEANANRYADAIRTNETFIHKYPNNRYTDDAHHALWKIYSEMKNEAKAKEALSTLLALPEGDMKNKILWENGYEAYKKGNYKGAINTLDRILSGRPVGDETYPQAIYWKARSQDRMAGSKDKVAGESRGLYQRLINDFPFSFYAVMAANRLGARPKSIGFPSGGADASGEILQTAHALNRLGFYQEGQKMVDYYAQKDPVTNEKQMNAFMAHQWRATRNYSAALNLAADFLEISPFATQLNTSSPLMQALYPMAYGEDVQAGYQKSGLPRGVIEGIMREESLFSPTVRSSAGAVGVMQLMPATASMQARKIGLPFSLADLNRPRNNILLGSTFFKSMVGTFGNHIPLAVMAYNAGPGNVRKWLNQKGNLPLDEFIEECPFSETRGYVKRVLRSMQVYGQLHNDPKLMKPFFSMKLP